MTTIDQLTDDHQGRKIFCELWSGTLVQYRKRVTPASKFGLVAIITEGKLKTYAVSRSFEFEME